jgi:hypothetical protein
MSVSSCMRPSIALLLLVLGAPLAAQESAPPLWIAAEGKLEAIAFEALADERLPAAYRLQVEQELADARQKHKSGECYASPTFVSRAVSISFAPPSMIRRVRYGEVALIGRILRELPAYKPRPVRAVSTWVELEVEEVLRQGPGPAIRPGQLVAFLRPAFSHKLPDGLEICGDITKVEEPPCGAPPPPATARRLVVGKFWSARPYLLEIEREGELIYDGADVYPPAGSRDGPLEVPLSALVAEMNAPAEHESAPVPERCPEDPSLTEEDRENIRESLRARLRALPAGLQEGEGGEVVVPSEPPPERP